MAWWDAVGVYKKITLIATMITAVIAAAIAFANAMQAGEPYWIATRGYTRDLIERAASDLDKTQQQLKTRQVQTEVQILKGRIEATRKSIADRELLLEKPEGAPPEYRRLISQQVTDFKDSLKLLEQQLDDLRRELAGRRP